MKEVDQICSGRFVLLSGSVCYGKWLDAISVTYHVQLLSAHIVQAIIRQSTRWKHCVRIMSQICEVSH
jgi:hypothetical protein